MGKKKKVRDLKEEKKARDAKLARLKTRASKNRAALKSLKKKENNAQRLYDELVEEFSEKMETRERRLATSKERTRAVQVRIDYIKLQIKLIDDPQGQKKLAVERHERAIRKINAEITKA